MGLTLPLLAICLGCWRVASGATEGKYTANRIIGGQEAVPHELPYQVSLQWNYGNDSIPRMHFCGGALLNDRWLVTAAHCNATYSADGFIEVVAGAHNISDLAESPAQRRKLERLVVHEDYCWAVCPNDLALIRVEPPFELGPHVRPIRLPGWNETFTGNALVSGWGATDPAPINPQYPDKLRKAVLPLVDYDTCRQLWYDVSHLARTNVCAGLDDGSRSSCTADSGGPLVTLAGDGDRVSDDPTLIGLVSWGPFPCGSPWRPNIFTGVAYFIDWIEQHMN